MLKILLIVVIATLTFNKKIGAEEENSPKIRVSPKYGTIGAVVIVDGCNFTDFQEIGIEFADYKTIKKFEAESGTFTVSFLIETSPKFGRVEIEAFGISYGELAKTEFILFPTQDLIYIHPSTGTVGSKVEVLAAKFPAKSNVALKFGSSLLNLSTNEEGILKEEIDVPLEPGGEIDIVVTQGGAEKEASFFIIPNLEEMYSSVRGRVDYYLEGEEVALKGNGFSASSPLYLSWGTGSFLPIGTSGTRGTFSLSFLIPAFKDDSYSQEGRHNLVLRDIFGLELTHEFKVYVKKPLIGNYLMVSPTFGREGSTFTVTGSNFLPSQTVFIFFSNVATFTTTADETGELHYKATVPYNAEVGPNLIVAKGEKGGTPAYTLFTRTSRKMGPVGAVVTIRGFGFARNETVNIAFGTISYLVTEVITDKGLVEDSMASGTKTITYYCSQPYWVATAITDNNGTFSISFLVTTNCTCGSRTISAYAAISKEQPTCSYYIMETIFIDTILPPPYDPLKHLVYLPPEEYLVYIKRKKVFINH